MSTQGRAGGSARDLLGFRAWRLSEGGLLRSVHFIGSGYGDWLPDDPYEARCPMRHPVPGEGCTCGVYAASELEDVGPQLMSLARDRAVILGQVRGWGRTVRHERGWRSQYAAPQTLLVPR